MKEIYKYFFEHTWAFLTKKKRTNARSAKFMPMQLINSRVDASRLACLSWLNILIQHTVLLLSYTYDEWETFDWRFWHLIIPPQRSHWTSSNFFREVRFRARHRLTLSLAHVSAGRWEMPIHRAEWEKMLMTTISILILKQSTTCRRPISPFCCSTRHRCWLFILFSVLYFVFCVCRAVLMSNVVVVLIHPRLPILFIFTKQTERERREKNINKRRHSDTTQKECQVSFGWIP